MTVCNSVHVGQPLLQTWRRQIGSYRHVPWRTPRDLVAFACLVQGSAPDGLLDLQRITICVLHDLPGPSGQMTIRFAGYRASVVPHGIALGGPRRMRFEKDLTRPPQFRAHGPRFGLDRSDLLPLALQMEWRLRRHARFPFFPRSNRLRLPQFYAALAIEDPIGDGPEFEAYCRKTGWEPKRPLVEWQRDQVGRALYPLEFVSHLWQRFRKVYVDLQTMRKSQVLRLKKLVGCQGACQFDFLGSRFPAAVAAA